MNCTNSCRKTVFVYDNSSFSDIIYRGCQTNGTGCNEDVDQSLKGKAECHFCTDALCNSGYGLTSNVVYSFTALVVAALYKQMF